MSKKRVIYALVALFVACVCYLCYTRRLKPTIYDGPSPLGKKIHLAVTQMPTT